jgi:glycosyltransferase involved in cell wall biosynthesis
MCLKDALKQQYDIIYEAGFTSIIPAYILFNIKKIKKPLLVTNIDGLEWKRAKFNKLVRKFILWEEKKVSQYCNYLIADNKGIQQYFKDTYKKDSFVLSYGASVCTNYSEKYIEKYNLINESYYLIIARLEPENNIEIIISGYLYTGKFHYPLVIVGKTDTSYGKYLIKKYKKYNNINFLGGIFDLEELNSIRHYSFSYFHGHSVGGTNPSLLEAMATECFIVAHNNPFNKNVLHDNAFFFSKASDIAAILISNEFNNKEIRRKYIINNLYTITNDYSWEKIIQQYEIYFQLILANSCTQS